MTRWFRVYDDLVDDPKVQRLDPSLFKTLINLWCLTSANRGVLPPINEIAFKLRMKPQKAQRILDRLKAQGLFEDDEKGTHPHNWMGRQYKSDPPNGCDVTVTGSVTTA
jgi:DNA-binding MarR family transcriptional regulator